MGTRKDPPVAVRVPGRRVGVLDPTEWLPDSAKSAAPLHPQRSCPWPSAPSPGHWTLPTTGCGGGPWKQTAQESGGPEEGRQGWGLAGILGWGDTQKGDIQGPGERGHSSFSSSSLFEVSLWFEFNFDFLNFSRLKLK